MKRKAIKKILCLITLLGAAAGLFCGCGKNGSDNASNVDSDGYAYLQELNIIDDNYRNYYEIFVGSYYDSDGDGYGDLNGVTEKLDYIEEMGFNGIWLMPIMSSPTYHKYDVRDYYTIDSNYGTIEDFENLVAECHERGIRIVIDLVMNHSSTQHTWFKEACEYLKTLGEDEEPDASVCKYVNYYHFSRTKESSSYYVVADTDSSWYYEAEFDYAMPDLNLENEDVREEFEQIASYWIDLGVDGFRMDAAMHYEENNISFNTETLNWLYTYCTDLNPDFYMVSEVWSSVTEIAAYYASETPSMFNFVFADSEGTLIKAGRGKTTATSFITKMITNDELFSGYYADYIDAPFITNHDMGRVANVLVNNETQMKMTAGFLLTMSGSPFVYYGEEIGMKSSGSSDPNKRLPMVWSKTDLTGIADLPTGADSGIESAFDGVDAQLEDSTSILNYYKRALRIRNENPEIARGKAVMVEELCVDYQAAITKTYNGSTIGIVYNNSEEEIIVDLNGTVLEEMGIRGYLTTGGEEITLSDGQLVMAPMSICILK